ncbi:MAG: rhodanese-like domain-containing protein [Acidobacteriota bacterium]
MDTHFGKMIFQTHPAELARRQKVAQWPLCVLDVRPAADFAAGHIPGALSLPAGAPTALPAGATPTTEIVVVGAGLSDPAMRATSLALLGLGARRVVELTEGMLGWRLAAMAVERHQPARAA